MDATPEAALLPRELMELQLGQIDLLMAMYPSEDEAVLDDGARALLSILRGWCDDNSAGSPPRIPPDLSLTLNLEVAAAPGGDPPRRLQLHIAWPLRWRSEAEDAADASAPPDPRVRVLQSDWLSRAETAQLAAGIPSSHGDNGGGGGGGEQDVLGAIEQIKEAAADLLATRGSAATAEGEQDGNSNSHAEQTQTQPLVRAWFYFPSISTRAKRDDLVRHAPAYGLTGFLLAGKPGVLCLEGRAPAIDAYMRFIKTESWGDIPPQHKKVSERYREETGAGTGGEGGGIARAFADMTEITETLGASRRGERANRTDMRALEAWLGERGLGDAFAKVLI